MPGYFQWYLKMLSKRVQKDIDEKRLLETSLTITTQPSCLDLKRLTRYRKMCHYEGGTFSMNEELVPPTYFDVLSSPLQMHPMASDGIPWTPSLLTHSRHDLHMHRIVHRLEEISMSMSVKCRRDSDGQFMVDYTTSFHAGSNSEFVCNVMNSFLFHRSKSPAKYSPQHTWATRGKPVQDFDIPVSIGREFSLRGYGDLSARYMSKSVSSFCSHRFCEAHPKWCLGRIFALLLLKGHLDISAGPVCMSVVFNAPVVVPARVLLLYDHGGPGNVTSCNNQSSACAPQKGHKTEDKRDDVPVLTFGLINSTSRSTLISGTFGPLHT
jgi:hypothetical protein